MALDKETKEFLMELVAEIKPSKKSNVIEFLKVAGIWIVSSAFFFGITIQRINSTFDEIDAKFKTTVDKVDTQFDAVQDHENDRAKKADKNFLIISKGTKLDPDILTKTADNE